MIDFKTRFAEYHAATDEYVFSNVRNGLIVGLVCLTSLIPCNHLEDSQIQKKKM